MYALLKTCLKKNTSLMLITLLVTPPVFGESFDLLKLYHLASEADTILQVAKATQRSVAQNLPQARAALLPNASLSANSSSNSINFPPSTYSSQTYNLSITQPLFHMDSWLALQKADVEVQQAVLNLAYSEQDLMVRLAQQYLAVLKANDTLHFSRSQRQAFAEQLAQTQQRFKVGLISITDVNDAQARHDSAYADEISAENQLANQKENLHQIVGTPIAIISPLKEILPLVSPQPSDMEHWVREALTHNLNLEAARLNVKISKKEIHKQQAGHLPTLDFSASRVYGKPYFPPLVNSGGTDNMVMLSVSLPLFSGGLTLSKTTQALYNYQKSSGELEGKRRLTESDTRQAYRGVLTQISQVHALKQAVLSSQSALDATQAAFSVGTRTMVDVLNAQSNVFSAEKNYAAARCDYILETLKLKKAAGHLRFEDLQEVNRWLQS